MEMKVERILWPTDLSDNAERALPFVTSLSEKYQAEVHVLYVLAALGNFGAWYGDFDQSEVQKLQRFEKERAEAALEKICSGSLQGCPLYIRHTAIGDPASEILKLLDREKPDLVIMATRGRHGQFQIGSVAEKVVRHSEVPVLTIPVKG
jgi:nucleotide-binding universal stress UspA family protein